ncbi:MAG: tRNA modification GTPase, partial [Muribaculaceae bacterium]|nr:tRNA modification GTPase [Muribaculaceae bacterium]
MDTIVAIATPYGVGGIAVVRLSGPDAFDIADRVWKGRSLGEAASHTARLGMITADDSGSPLDQCVATVFRAPASYTGEDTVEFSVHGSKWIQRQVVDRLVTSGARPAEPGEFTRRAFLNGRLDLAQAEGVADLIAASSRAAHRLAMSQVTGGFSARIDSLREKLIDLASLLELELDFSEEDVEFADRARLRSIAEETISMIDRLAATYASGRAFKEGIPVAIAGRPNAGKSTLLNALLGEDKAIVSDIPGTTRDVIDDTREIGGILFRFYDTAG